MKSPIQKLLASFLIISLDKFLEEGLVGQTVYIAKLLSRKVVLIYIPNSNKREIFIIYKGFLSTECHE